MCDPESAPIQSERAYLEITRGLLSQSREKFGLLLYSVLLAMTAFGKIQEIHVEAGENNEHTRNPRSYRE
jgi:hypothetical protein